MSTFCTIAPLLMCPQCIFIKLMETNDLYCFLCTVTHEDGGFAILHFSGATVYNCFMRVFTLLNLKHMLPCIYLNAEIRSGEHYTWRSGLIYNSSGELIPGMYSSSQKRSSMYGCEQDVHLVCSMTQEEIDLPDFNFVPVIHGDQIHLYCWSNLCSSSKEKMQSIISLLV